MSVDEVELDWTMNHDDDGDEEVLAEGVSSHSVCTATHCRTAESLFNRGVSRQLTEKIITSAWFTATLVITTNSIYSIVSKL